MFKKNLVIATLFVSVFALNTQASAADDVKNKVRAELLQAQADGSIYCMDSDHEVECRIRKMAVEAKQKLIQAQAAKGPERKTLMAEHMKMMQEIMDKMIAMKPKAGMSMKNHEEWINEHQKLMQQVMEQMMGEHHLMMQSCDAMGK